MRGSLCSREKLSPIVSKGFPALDGTFPRIIPAFGKLVKILTECAGGGVQLGCTYVEYKECDGALGSLLGGFLNSLRLKEIPAECGAQVNEVLRLFSAMSVSMLRLLAALQRNRVPLAQQSCQDICAALLELERISGEISNVVNAVKSDYSDVPVVNCVLAAGYSVLEGRNEWDVLAVRLEVLVPDWNKILENKNLPAEVTAHDEALDNLVRVVQARDKERLPEALAEMKITGEALVRLQAVPEVEQSLFLCPWCGKEVNENDRICPSCAQRLPDKMGEKCQQEGQLPGGMPDYVQNLFDVAKELPNNDKLFGKFRRSVAELRRRCNIAINQLDKISPAGAKLSNLERERFDGAYDLAMSGLDKFSRSVDLLEGFDIPVDRFHLQCALELVAAAVEDMRRVRGLAQSLKK